jgi:anti-sigma regulatory factor (Ser/Thr protein kinase)
MKKGQDKEKSQSEEIGSFIIQNISENPQTISRITTEKFGITRQAVSRYIKRLIKDGVVEATGTTRDRAYKLKDIVNKSYWLPIKPDLEEDRVWRQEIKHLLTSVPASALDICQYGFTEMLNNVIDHSEGHIVAITIILTAAYVEIRIDDDGVGIFNKVKNILGLEDYRHAILELAKGKLTTDPDHHTGEGIFFTSRMFDYFSISSSHLYFRHRKTGDDWLIEDSEGEHCKRTCEHCKGTCVCMQISTSSSDTAQAIFNLYATEDNDYGFTKTRVPVSLLKYSEESLVSRSQAKRLLARFDKFKEVFLDFQGIATIGQAFADEIFRVYQKQNPQVKILWVNANQEVKKMIMRALSESAPISTI